MQILAILGNKPVGTKIAIQNNVVYLQDPGPFQFICRYIFKSNKTDLQYMYNTIQIACHYFLSKEYIQKTPCMKSLFVCAKNGIKKLIDTYKLCPIIGLTLNYYNTIISNYVDEIYNNSIFQKDTMTSLYAPEIINSLNEKWTDEKIKVVLDLICFLSNDSMATNNVKSLENIMNTIDAETQELLSKC